MIIDGNKILVCLRCGHEWANKKHDIRSCPKCHSALWDVPKEVKT